VQIHLDVSLDPTLGCGQAHRWRKSGDKWTGVIGEKIVTLAQSEQGFECEGCSSKTEILAYFRSEDDLDHIVSEISKADPYVAALARSCPGMRILKQNEWECLATYVLATNVNVKRIAKMTESVCDQFGKNLGERRAFPSPKEILDGKERICECKLGFRESRFIELAERTEKGEIDLDAISEMDYERCIGELMKINGVGPKVADCVALFGFGHLEAFPIDARISKCLDDIYGKTGNYRELSAFGRNLFGAYAGYAQEFLYHSGNIIV
jgi:3-methyladenine DNA glycosylase/8-oxoguanine DNA glycosylase